MSTDNPFGTDAAPPSPPADDPRDRIIAAQAEEIAALRGRRNAPAAEVPSAAHTVEADETLSSIAAKYGSSAEVVYGVNKTAIEGGASSRGFPDSEGGRILFPGTVLKVPHLS